MRLFGVFCLIVLAGKSAADTVVPAQVIRPRTVISADQIAVRPVSIVGAIADPTQVIGMEARVALYPGRPIRMGDVGAPAVIERNQLVSLVFENAFLNIATEGRALGRAETDARGRRPLQRCVLHLLADSFLGLTSGS